MCVLLQITSNGLNRCQHSARFGCYENLRHTKRKLRQTKNQKPKNEPQKKSPKKKKKTSKKKKKTPKSFLCPNVDSRRQQWGVRGGQEEEEEVVAELTFSPSEEQSEIGHPWSLVLNGHAPLLMWR